MKFRPCIDIHNGKVKQIVGGSLKDAGKPGTGEFLCQSRMQLFMLPCIKEKRPERRTYYPSEQCGF